MAFIYTLCLCAFNFDLNGEKDEKCRFCSVGLPAVVMPSQPPRALGYYSYSPAALAWVVGTPTMRISSDVDGAMYMLEEPAKNVTS